MTPKQSRVDVNQVGDAGDILAIVAPGFHAGDLHAATGRVQNNGFAVKIASTVDSLVEGEGDRGDTLSFVVDTPIAKAEPAKYAGLVIPGGDRHLAALDDHENMEELVRAFIDAKKPVLAWAEAARFLAPYSRTPEIIRESRAAVAVNGEVYPAATEEAQDDAAEVYMKALALTDNKAA